MGMSLKDVFGKIWDNFESSVKDSLVQTAGQMPEVQEAIDDQKVKVGKDVLWRYFPFIAIGGILIYLIARFK